MKTMMVVLVYGCSGLTHHQTAACCLSCRKVKYLNMRGSLVDEHTVRGVAKAGKEVGG